MSEDSGGCEITVNFCDSDYHECIAMDTPEFALPLGENCHRQEHRRKSILKHKIYLLSGFFFFFHYVNPFRVIPGSSGGNKQNSSSVQEHTGDTGEISVDLIYVAFGSHANCLL